MLTMTVKSGGGTGDYTPGWKKVTVKSAAYGTHEQSRFIDMWFEEYGDNFNARIWEKKDKEGNEFAIANLFRFANAGIETVQANGSANSKVVQINDKAENLHTKQIWIYLYKNEEGYARVLQRIAPVEFTNELDTIDDSSVTYWKTKAEQYFTDWVEPNIAKSSGGGGDFITASLDEVKDKMEDRSTTTGNSTDVFSGMPE